MLEHRVFVYGSLLQGEDNHHWLEENGARLIDSVALTKDTEFVMVFGGEGAANESELYPFLLDEGRACDTRGAVRGELYEVNGSTLAKLDELEAHPIEYRRRKVPVHGHSDEAWLYVFEEKDTLLEIYKDLDSSKYISVPRLDWRTFRRSRYPLRSRTQAPLASNVVFGKSISNGNKALAALALAGSIALFCVARPPSSL